MAFFDLSKLNKSILKLPRRIIVLLASLGSLSIRESGNDH